MEPRDSTGPEISIQVTDDIRLAIESGDEAICYTNVYYAGEHIARLNNPMSKPWQELSLVMASQTIVTKSEAYDSREELEKLQYEAMLEHREELDEVFGWDD